MGHTSRVKKTYEMPFDPQLIDNLVKLHIANVKITALILPKFFSRELFNYFTTSTLPFGLKNLFKESTARC